MRAGAIRAPALSGYPYPCDTLRRENGRCVGVTSVEFHLNADLTTVVTLNEQANAVGPTPSHIPPKDCLTQAVNRGIDYLITHAGVVPNLLDNRL